MNKYQLPVASWVESFTDWLTSTFAGLFSFLQTIGIKSVMDNITALLTAVPPLVLPFVKPSSFISNKKIGLSLFTFIGLSSLSITKTYGTI